MRQIGVQELKARASDILRNVGEKNATYVITYQGKPYGVLMPVNKSKQKSRPTRKRRSKRGNSAWAAYERTAEQVRRAWMHPKITQQLMDEIRR